MSVIENVENANEQIIEGLESFQTMVLRANKKVATELVGRMSSIPTVPVLGDVAERLPSPTVALNTYFNLVERATKANRKFATDLLGVWADADEAVEAEVATAAATVKAETKTAKAKAEKSDG